MSTVALVALTVTRLARATEPTPAIPVRRVELVSDHFEHCKGEDQDGKLDDEWQDEWSRQWPRRIVGQKVKVEAACA